MSQPTTTRVTCKDIVGNETEVSVSQLRWRPSAYGVVIEGDRILLTKQHGGYSLPGGGVDLGEMPEAAVVRETKEETGVDVECQKLLGVASNFFELPDSKKGNYIQSILMYYRCKFLGGELSIDGFDEDEKLHGEMPDWIEVSALDEISVVGSVDWRPYVRQSLAEA